MIKLMKIRITGYDLHVPVLITEVKGISHKIQAWDSDYVVWTSNSHHLSDLDDETKQKILDNLA